MGQIDIMCLYGGGCNMCYPAKNTKPESNHEETLDKRKSREVLQNNWPVLFTNVKDLEDKEVRNQFRLKETKDMTSKFNVWSWIGSWIRKDFLLSIKDTCGKIE